MLHSGLSAAKSLSGNKLTTRKVHLVGAAGHYVPAILWPNPQFQLSSLLTFERMTIDSGHGDGRPSETEAFTFAAVAMELNVRT